MKNANKRDQFLPSTEGIIFSVMKDECFKLPCLKPSTGFPFALKIKSKLLNMVHRSSRTWSLLTSLPHLLINDVHILFIQTGSGARNLGCLCMWDSYADILETENIVETEHFIAIIS